MWNQGYYVCENNLLKCHVLLQGISIKKGRKMKILENLQNGNPSSTVNRFHSLSKRNQTRQDITLQERW